MSDQTRRQLLQHTALAAGAAALFTKAVAQDAPQQFPSGSPEGAAAAAAKFFPGFKQEMVKTSGATINVVSGGNGPAVLLMHGAPQTVISWRLVAPELAKTHRVIMMDLRGYGDSSKPAGGADHSDYSKRNMALDGVEVMKHFGVDRFPVIGHDRGGRVGHRMALDHPDKVTRLAVLDIVPQHYLYTHVTLEFVRAYPHWFNYLLPGAEEDLLAQNRGRGAAKGKAPAAPDAKDGGKGGDGKAKAFAKGKGGGGGDGAAAEYARHTTDAAMIHGMCEDYRAAASVDLQMDESDRKAGKKVNQPLVTLWAANGAMGRIYDVLAIWKEYGKKVSGKGLPPPATHSLQESSPEATLVELQAFLKG